VDQKVADHDYGFIKERGALSTEAVVAGTVCTIVTPTEGPTEQGTVVDPALATPAAGPVPVRIS